MQIFFLPFAGGNCYSFDFLKDFFDESNEMHFLELPGRGRRMTEALLLSAEECIADYVNQMKALRNRNLPYVIYGHSMGAVLGLSVAKMMERYGDSTRLLVVSGNSGSLRIELDEDGLGERYRLNDDKFKDLLKGLGGVPDEVLENDELYAFYSPIIRADFRVLEMNKSSDRSIIIKSPIFAMMGDLEKDCHKIKNWQKFTSSRFDFKCFNGGHFFIHDNAEELAEIIQSKPKKVKVIV